MNNYEMLIVHVHSSMHIDYGCYIYYDVTLTFLELSPAKWKIKINHYRNALNYTIKTKW